MPGTHAWKNDAACHGQWLLFDEDEDGYYPFEEEAKALCNECPVMMLCRKTAMNNRERSGIWGGKKFLW